MSAARIPSRWVVVTIVACALTAVFLAGVLPPLPLLIATLALILLVVVVSLFGREPDGGEDR